MNQKKGRKIKSGLLALWPIGILSLFFLPSLLETYSAHAILSNKIEVGEPYGLCHAGYSLLEQEYSLLKALGNQWIRADFPWYAIEPVEKEWHYEYYDQFVATATNHSQKILAILALDVGWLNYSEELRPSVKPEHIPFYLDYVNQTVSRYKDNVTAWGIWNEPNTDVFWKGTKEDFFNLFNQTAELIYRIRPNTTIVGGVISVSGHDPRYIGDMFQAGIMNRVSAIAFHPYAGEIQEVYHKILQVKEIGNAFGYKGEYWISEVGNPSGGNGSHRVTLEELPATVIKTLVYAAISDIRTIIWYRMYDDSDDAKKQDPGNSELYFGLIYPNNTWKTGAYAFQLFSRHASHTEYRPDLLQEIPLDASNSLKSFLFRKSSGETLLIVWNDPIISHSQLLDYEEIPIIINISNNASNILTHKISDGTNATMVNFPLHITGEPLFLTYTATDADDIVTINIQGFPISSLTIIILPILLASMIALIYLFPGKSG